MIFRRVLERKDETPTVSTLYFDWEANVEPGQFVMVWIPGVGEIPMSLSITKGLKAMTVKEYGPTSGAMRNLKVGERIFFRGPYGKPFTREAGDVLLVGGGAGMASLRPLITRRSYGIVSARTKSELLFANEFVRERVFTVTDDGSAGIMGTPVDKLKELDLGRFDRVYVCGPEMMLKAVFEHLMKRKVKVEFSLERIMKCGIGVCDSCSVGGYQICRDGPTFDIEKLERMSEFGETKLTVSGKRIKA